MNLNNKVAIVTGGADGIGKSIVTRFVKSGARVVFCDLNVKLGNRVANAFNRGTTKVIFVNADVSQPADVNRVVTETINQFKRIDVLVNNAGIMNNYRVEELTVETWDKTMAINLRGTFLFSRAVVPHMKKQNRGKIINISSLAGRTGGIMVGIDYATSKGGILALTKSLARELAPYKINVNAICPGTTKTGLINKFTKGQQTELIHKIPLGRLAVPDDIANSVLFLASDFADYITGATIDVNGGLLMF